MSVSSRHESTLGGRLRPFDPAYQIDVDVEIDPSIARAPSSQHCAWMLINMLCRMDGIVRRVGFVCPDNIPLQRRIIPVANSTNLRDAVVAASRELDIVPLMPSSVGGMTLLVGKTPKNSGIAVLGSGWSGGVSTIAMPDWPIDSNLPFGPYIAACLAVGEVFKRARLPEGTYSTPDAVFYSAWDLRARSAPQPVGPEDLTVQLDILLAGVGAVGSSFIHCLWACDGITGKVLLADNDEKGLDETNLNRYVLFSRPSLGLRKAVEAARIVTDCGIEWDPRNTPAEQVADFEWTQKRVISAVDKNRSRAAIQDRYPARIIGASTSDLRAEILRCGPPGVGACLRCFNPPEQLRSDERIRQELGVQKEQVISALAASADVDISEANEWIASGRCGTAGERLLTYIRRTETEPHEFAVGFVSVLAGVLAAAEVVKDTIGATVPLSSAQQRATFQFWNPGSPSNSSKHVQLDPTCPKCASAAAIAVSKNRFEAVGPTR